ncbi:translation initiation factor eIF-2B [Patescibacteria group bacterium]|nr:translation initiation factor eIF-2B [Patescibacteria group bacterium]
MLKINSKKNKQKTFDKIVKKIKSVKIQGARNIAKAAFEAYSLIPNKNSKKILLSSRPTEPMVGNVLDMAEKKIPSEEILKHFDNAQEKINKELYKLIKKNFVIFTHCHSSNVCNALIYSKEQGKKFEAYVTETRPLLQGRKTAKSLKKAKIETTLFVDSAIGIALSKEQGTKKADIVFLGADALLEEGIINKVGSEIIARIAKEEKIPLYIVADSWKFTKKEVPIEQRELNEVWDKAPKKIKIKNPAFEFVPKKYLTGIITELGLMNYDSFVKKILK